MFDYSAITKLDLENDIKNLKKFLSNPDDWRKDNAWYNFSKWWIWSYP